jgi:hypothetical protein
LFDHRCGVLRLLRERSVAKLTGWLYYRFVA